MANSIAAFTPGKTCASGDKAFYGSHLYRLLNVPTADSHRAPDAALNLLSANY